MIQQLIAFSAASLIVIVTPGPDAMLVLRNTALAGRAGALWTAVGIMTGLGVLATAAAVGVTALVTASPTLFHTIRILGGLYLLFLGIQALRSYLRLRRTRYRAEPDTVEPRPELVTPGRVRAFAFRQGLLSNLLNPKVAAFYLSLFPQFDLAPLPPLTQHVLLAAMFWTFCLIWYVVFVGLIGRLAPLLRSPTVTRRTEAAAGGAFIGLSAYVLARTG